MNPSPSRCRLPKSYIYRVNQLTHMPLPSWYNTQTLQMIRSIINQRTPRVDWLPKMGHIRLRASLIQRQLRLMN